MKQRKTNKKSIKKEAKKEASTHQSLNLQEIESAYLTKKLQWLEHQYNLSSQVAKAQTMLIERVVTMNDEEAKNVKLACEALNTIANIKDPLLALKDFNDLAGLIAIHQETNSHDTK